ncbi:MAG: ImmA/IrrE family metallo-endopeptidase [Deltaproteobacteria bacterium]|nr:ImmA/IrrE family metallo-endopeptidase [Deltaproteobacteria bacterium]
MFNIPYLSYADIGSRVQAFLNQHHPSFEIPIPVEEIIELNLGLDIFPFPRLYKDHGLNGFLSRDISTIYVDETQYSQFNEKYRYTLAHELGHYVLHKTCYDDLPFRTPDEYVKWRLSLLQEDISWFETQGEWFAGQLLVPTVQLEKVCNAVVAKYQETFKKFAKMPDDVWSYISNEVATHFDVNPPVVEIRIKKENIPAKIPIQA